MSPLRLVVLGTAASNPYAGMAWMHMQIAAGLGRLGHDVHYLETTSNWPYDPVRETKVCDSDYAVPYLARLAESFGLEERWAYRRSYSDREWVGPARRGAEELLRRADAVFNVAGSTRLDEDGLDPGRLVFLDTDPIFPQVAYASGEEAFRSVFGACDDAVTYGENIGTDACPVPALPQQRATMRQPVLIDLWQDGPPVRGAFTTVANWRQDGREVEFGGVRYAWSKDVEFRKFAELPARVGPPLELATNMGEARNGARAAEGEAVPAWGVERDALETLRSLGWRLVDAGTFSGDPWRYRDYVRHSRGEFTVARDLHVRLRSGWFSERSACYLAAGRPVITQDTGFGTVLPTGEGLFAFTTLDEAAAAFEAVESDYERHSRAAREIGEEYFRAETVLARMLEDLAL
jgi:hypothetical protein